MIIHDFPKTVTNIQCSLLLFFLALTIIFIVPALAYTQIPDAFPPATPENQGISSAAIQEMVDTVQGYFDNNLIVGAELLVIKNRHTILHEAFGWKDREDREPMERNTIFNIRSMSKPFTGAAAQILIDEGKLHLEDKASDFLTGFRNSQSEDITIKQLLTHRSGLPLSILTSLNEYPNLLEIANAVGRHGPDYEPESKFWYSDAGSESLGAVVEQVSGLLLDEFITERFLKPLGMNDSFSFSPNDENQSLWQRVASLYGNYSGPWAKFWEPEGTPFYPYAWGSQTIYSTPMDYAKFLAMWMDDGITLDGNRILSQEAIIRTLTPVSVMSSLGSDAPAPTGFPETKPYYGQMSVLYVPFDDLDSQKPEVIGHSGSDGTFAWAWPDQDLMVLYFTQSRGGLSGIRLETVIDRLLTHPDREIEISEELQDYVGTYRVTSGSQINREFTIIPWNGHIALDIPQLFIFELKEPDNRGRWYTTITNEFFVTFRQDSDGAVTGMRFFESGHGLNFSKIEPTSVSDWQVF